MRVSSATFSPDGSRVLTASADNTAVVWAVATATKVQVLSGHRDALTSATFKPDGTAVGTAGGDSTGGAPGRFTLRFDHPGTFTYYCRFHAHLDSANQPVAPGPLGGIKDASGNFGTPMMGVITVLGEGDN